VNGAVEVERLSLRELCDGKLEGGLFYWGSWRICKGRFWRRASVSMGASLLGNMEGCSFPRAFERREKFLCVGKFLLGISEKCI